MAKCVDSSSIDQGFIQDRLAFIDRVGADPIDVKKAEDQKTIGGLRRTAKSVLKVPGLADRGKVVAGALDKLYDRRPEIEDKIWQAISQRSSEQPLDGAELDTIAETI